MEYVGHDSLLPSLIDKILEKSKPRKISSNTVIFLNILQNAVDENETALLRLKKERLALKGELVPDEKSEVVRDRLILHLFSSSKLDQDQLEKFSKKEFEVYFRSTRLIYGFVGKPSLVQGDYFIFDLPRNLMRIDRRKEPRIETSFLPQRLQKEVSTILFNGEKFYNLQCKLLDISSGGLGINVSSTFDDKRYENLIKQGLETSIEFVVDSVPLFAKVKFVYVDREFERAGLKLFGVIDNRKNPGVKHVQAWIDKALFGEAINTEKVKKEKKVKRVTAVTTSRVLELQKEFAKSSREKRVVPEVGAKRGAERAGQGAQTTKEEGQLSGVLSGASSADKEPVTSTLVPTLKVAIIDTHFGEARNIYEFLSKRTDRKFDIHFAADFESGLKLILTKRPDLILLDPNIDGDINEGIFLFQRIKSHPFLKHSTRSIITSALDKLSIEKFVSAGVNHVVSKKSPLDTLWRKITEVLD